MLIWCIFLVGTSDEKEMSVFVEHLIIYLQYRNIGNTYPFFLPANHAWPIKKMKLVKRSSAGIEVLCSIIGGNSARLSAFRMTLTKGNLILTISQAWLYCCWRNQRCILRTVHRNTHTLSWSLLYYQSILIFVQDSLILYWWWCV